MAVNSKQLMQQPENTHFNHTLIALFGGLHGYICRI